MSRRTVLTDNVGTQVPSEVLTNNNYPRSCSSNTTSRSHVGDLHPVRNFSDLDHTLESRSLGHNRRQSFPVNSGGGTLSRRSSVYNWYEFLNIFTIFWMSK